MDLRKMLKGGQGLFSSGCVFFLFIFVPQISFFVIFYLCFNKCLPEDKSTNFFKDGTSFVSLNASVEKAVHFIYTYRGSPLRKARKMTL